MPTLRFQWDLILILQALVMCKTTEASIFGPGAHWKGMADGKFSQMNSALARAVSEYDVEDIDQFHSMLKDLLQRFEGIRPTRRPPKIKDEHPKSNRMPSFESLELEVLKVWSSKF